MSTTSTLPVALASSAENMGEIVRKAPASYTDNQNSHDNCLRHCRALLEQIQTGGMTDDLDLKAAKFIERTRRTLKEMNERRSPVTKLFDRVRAEFTILENEIDPAKAGTVPYQLQQFRNQYAERKHREEEERRRAEEARRQAELARTQYRDACTDDFKAIFNARVANDINLLNDIVSNATLDKWQQTLDAVTGYSVELPADWCPASSVRMPLNLPVEESRAICKEVLDSLVPQFREQYRVEIGDYRQQILDRLPSQKAELERAASAASAEEAQKIRRAIARREAAERAAKEQERAAREREEARKAEARKASAQAAGLFDVARAATPAYQPKTKVSKKIRVTAPNGYLQVLMMWWAKEGCGLPDAELAKIFKKQISFCERLANKEGEVISDPSVEYVDEVKAQ